MTIDALITKMKRDIEKRYVYVMMKPEELQTLLDAIEEKEDAISYAMNQIQIKESHIRKMEGQHAAS